MRLPQPREGEQVSVRGRNVDFSLWPVRQTKGGGALNPRLFVADPWPVMAQVVGSLKKKVEKEAGMAFLEQARDFFHAASRANTAAAKPLLLYYCFLNLAKALILVRIPGTSLDTAHHGLSEKLKAGKKELFDAYLVAKPTNPNNPMVFDLLLKAIKGTGLAAQTNYDVTTIMRQVVTGHRLFLGATGKLTENFLSPDLIEILHDSSTHDCWLRMSFASGDLSRLGLGHTKLLQSSKLAADWRAVCQPGSTNNHVWFEQVNAVRYSRGWIADKLMPVIEQVRHHLWQAVLSVPPYRAYYLYLPPTAEMPFVLPQILSSYALFFYFGSITRYRPHHFDRILEGGYGAFTESFLNDQPSQLLFLFASEFARREVARAAIV